MRYRLLLKTAAFAAAADALTKTTAVALSRWMPVRLPGGWAVLVAHNNGVVLGIGAGTAAPDVFAALAVVEIAVLLFINRRQYGPVWAVAFGLLIGGAAANLGDHQLFGYVVDWIRPPQPPIAFDLADVAVVIGQVLLIALQVLGTRASRVRTPRGGDAMTHRPRRRHHHRRMTTRAADITIPRTSLQQWATGPRMSTPRRGG